MEVPAEVAAGIEASGGVQAVHNGEVRDLAEDGWGTATRCVEYTAELVICYDSDEEYAADFTARTGQPARDIQGESAGVDARLASGDFAVARVGNHYDCPRLWVCLWQYSNYSASGRMLQWSAAGTKELGDYNFRDMASSAFANRPQSGYRLTDVRSFFPDSHLYLGASGLYPRLGDYGWDNRADRLTIY